MPLFKKIPTDRNLLGKPQDNQELSLLTFNYQKALRYLSLLTLKNLGLLK